jgi:hypothetical protein
MNPKFGHDLEIALIKPVERTAGGGEYATTYCREGFEREGFKKLSKRISFSHTPLSSSFRKFSGRAVSVTCRERGT